MNPELLLTSVSLAMDCFSVSISSSACSRQFKFREALVSATSFGSFQFSMLLGGWFIGDSILNYIEALDHWVAFLLLFLVGVKMIRGERGELRVSSLAALMILSVATSIDALSVGMALPILGIGMLAPALVAGASSFFFTIAGYRLGWRLGAIVGERAEKLGGVILVIIGIKVLLEHTLFNSFNVN